MKNLKPRMHVLVCDGQRRILLKNDGSSTFPILSVLDTREQIVPPSRELGTDAPVRVHESVGKRRSSIEQTDYHQRQEEFFAREIAEDMEKMVASKVVEALIVVAPPRFLANIRKFFSSSVRKVIVAEIDKDLTKLPTHEIEEYLVAHLK